MALLISGCDEARFWMHCHKRLAESVSENSHGFSIGRNSENGAVVPADRRSFLAALRNYKRAIWCRAHACGELPRFRRLRKHVGEKLVNVSFSVVVGVQQSPDAIPIE